MTYFTRRNLMRLVPGGAYVAEGAVVTGNINFGKDASVWFGCVLRGDDAPLSVGARTNIQDMTVMHADTGVPNVIGEDVTVGHGVVLHGAQIGDRCLIGMGAVLLGGCVIGEESLIAAGTVVKQNFVVPPRSLVAGVPGRILRSVKDEHVAAFLESAAHYVKTIKLYLEDAE